MLQKCYMKRWAGPEGAGMSANWWKHLNMESIKHGNKTYLPYATKVLLKNKNKNTKVSVNSSMTWILLAEFATKSAEWPMWITG